MFLRILRALSILVVFCSTTWVFAQDSPLKFFSQDVDVLIRLSVPGRTLEKVADLAEKVQPESGAWVRTRTDVLGQAISNPELTGVDQLKDWYAGVYAHGEQPPIVVFAIPALNVDDMKAALGEEMTVQVHDGWVLYTEHDEIPVVEGKSVDQVWNEQTKSAMSDSDLCLFINAGHLTQTYGDQLEAKQDEVLDGLNALRFMSAQSGMNMQGMVDLYGAMAEKSFQAVRDGRSLTVAVALSEGEIAIDDYLEFNDGSPTSSLLSELHPRETPLLQKLAAGAQIYFGLNGNLQQFNRSNLELTASMFETSIDRQKLEAVMNRLDELDFGPVVGAVEFTGAPEGMFYSTGVGEVSSAEKLQEINRDMYDLLAHLETGGLKQEVTVNKDAESYGTRQADVVTITQEFDAGGRNVAGLQETFEKLFFGKEGMKFRLLYPEGRYLTTMSGGQEAMQRLLASLEQSNSQSLATYARPLETSANLLAYVDLPSIGAQIIKSVSRIEELPMPLPLSAEMIDDLDIKPSYVGLAVAAQPNAIKLQTRIPVEQVEGLFRLGTMIRDAFKPGL